MAIRKFSYPLQIRSKQNKKVKAQDLGNKGLITDSTSNKPKTQIERKKTKKQRRKNKQTERSLSGNTPMTEKKPLRNKREFSFRKRRPTTTLTYNVDFFLSS
ncbi:hypothetical protein V6Z11_A01G044400 [Gossypium hirsutum]